MVSVSGASVSVRCTSGCEWYMVSLSVSGVLVSVKCMSECEWCISECEL